LVPRGIFQEILAQELGLVKLDPLCALFGKCHHWRKHLIGATLPHELAYQYLGRNFDYFVVDFGYGITPFLLLQLVFIFHGLYDGQITALTLENVCGVLSFTQEPGNSMDEVVHNEAYFIAFGRSLTIVGNWLSLGNSPTTSTM